MSVEFSGNTRAPRSPWARSLAVMLACALTAPAQTLPGQRTRASGQPAVAEKGESATPQKKEPFLDLIGGLVNRVLERISSDDVLVIFPALSGDPRLATQAGEEIAKRIKDQIAKQQPELSIIYGSNIMDALGEFFLGTREYKDPASARLLGAACGGTCVIAGAISTTEIQDPNGRAKAAYQVDLVAYLETADARKAAVPLFQDSQTYPKTLPEGRLLEGKLTRQSAVPYGADPRATTSTVTEPVTLFTKYLNVAVERFHETVEASGKAPRQGEYATAPICSTVEEIKGSHLSNLITAALKTTFGGLSPEQLNTKLKKLYLCAEDFGCVDAVLDPEICEQLEIGGIIRAEYTSVSETGRVLVEFSYVDPTEPTRKVKGKGLISDMRLKDYISGLFAKKYMPPPCDVHISDEEVQNLLYDEVAKVAAACVKAHIKGLKKPARAGGDEPEDLVLKVLPVVLPSMQHLQAYLERCDKRLDDEYERIKREKRPEWRLEDALHNKPGDEKLRVRLLEEGNKVYESYYQAFRDVILYRESQIKNMATSQFCRIVSDVVWTRLLEDETLGLDSFQILRPFEDISTGSEFRNETEREGTNLRAHESTPSAGFLLALEVLQAGGDRVMVRARLVSSADPTRQPPKSSKVEGRLGKALLAFCSKKDTSRPTFESIDSSPFAAPVPAAATESAEPQPAAAPEPLPDEEDPAESPATPAATVVPASRGEMDWAEWDPDVRMENGLPTVVRLKGKGPKIVLRLISGGKYQRGAHKDVSFADRDEKPEHTVQVSTFYIGEAEITQGEWAAVMQGNPSHNKLGDEYPMENVSWLQVGAFLEKTGLRLPTEAEWEHACRGGDGPGILGTSKRITDVQMQEDAVDKAAWYDKNSHGQTQPVRKKQPNAFGLYDIYGNVSEWCSDHYNPGEYAVCATNAVNADPKGPATSQHGRVVRGAHYSSKGHDLRPSTRRRAGESTTLPWVGFRVARSVSRP